MVKLTFVQNDQAHVAIAEAVRSVSVMLSALHASHAQPDCEANVCIIVNLKRCSPSRYCRSWIVRLCMIIMCRAGWKESAYLMTCVDARLALVRD